MKITTDVADALDDAHRQNVIHRDVKPENILLHDGRPMVADFGIALAVDAAGAERLTETGLSLGTPAYMSPEQASARSTVVAISMRSSACCMKCWRQNHHSPVLTRATCSPATQRIRPRRLRRFAPVYPHRSPPPSPKHSGRRRRSIGRRWIFR